jgi:acyl carrier protein|tara:strand:- start:12068 stop:12301 length:234 start_codon:yes stop_codon:yes gene_type:complete
MTKDELFLLIKDALDADNEIDINASADNIPEWDSLGHLSVLTALDDATDGKASSLTDLSDATSVTEIVNILEAQEII